MCRGSCCHSRRGCCSRRCVRDPAGRRVRSCCRGCFDRSGVCGSVRGCQILPGIICRRASVSVNVGRSRRAASIVPGGAYCLRVHSIPPGLHVSGAVSIPLPGVQASDVPPASGVQCLTRLTATLPEPTPPKNRKVRDATSGK